MKPITRDLLKCAKQRKALTKETRRRFASRAKKDRAALSPHHCNVLYSMMAYGLDDSYALSIIGPRIRGEFV